MIRKLHPNFQFDRLQDISPEFLKCEGIGGLLLDLDNTVSPWNNISISKEVISWFEEIKDAGLKACIISNNRRPYRVSAVAKILDIDYVYNAAKPGKKAYLNGLAAIGTKVSETAVIGDQIFTDIFGGKRLGFRTILVNPLSKREFAGTKVLRLMERLAGREVRYLN